MSKQVADGFDADAAPEQSHGKGMTQLVRRCTIERKTIVSGPVIKNLADAVVLHRGNRASDAQEQLRQVAFRPARLEVTPQET